MLAFSYGFKHVNQADADRYLVDSKGMRKYSEWQSPAITYWGPSTNSVEGRLVYKFDFSAATASIRLKADSPTWNFFVEPGGRGRGASSLEVSKEGTTWVSLRNNLEPRNWGGDWSINDPLPSSVLGATSLFVRMRFFVENAPNSSYTVAQFGRSTSAASANVFEINATFATNSAPTDVVASATTVAENMPAGTTVGMLTAEDPDAGNTFTYSLVSGTGSTDNAAFTIDGDQLRTAASFDFETKNTYSVRVRATDQGGLFTEKVLSVGVTDVTAVNTSRDSKGLHHAKAVTLRPVSSLADAAGNRAGLNIKSVALTSSRVTVAELTQSRIGIASDVARGAAHEWSRINFAKL